MAGKSLPQIGQLDPSSRFKTKLTTNELCKLALCILLDNAFIKSVVVQE
ncbi:hypothetical protein ES703_96137 [subsurface metagenome]